VTAGGGVDARALVAGALDATVGLSDGDTAALGDDPAELPQAATTSPAAQTTNTDEHPEAELQVSQEGLDRAVIALREVAGQPVAGNVRSHQRNRIIAAIQGQGG
jgi:hypothetical protein